MEKKTQKFSPKIWNLDNDVYFHHYYSAYSWKFLPVQSGKGEILKESKLERKMLTFTIYE